MREKMKGTTEALKKTFEYQRVVEKERLLNDFMGGPPPDVDWTGAAEDTQYFTHGFHPYPARMPPHISRRLISMYSHSKSDVLLDPYCGSGGVLVEGMLQGHRSIGVDLNPLAVLIAKVKTTPIAPERLEATRKSLVEEIEKELSSNAECEPPKIKRLGFWFKPEAIHELCIIKENLELLKEQKDIYDFFRVCFSLSVRKASNIRNGEFKLYARQGEELVRFIPEAFRQFRRITLRNIEKMRNFVRYIEKHDVGEATVLEGDTRSLLKLDPELLDEKTVSLVVTSPPYGDSHTTVAYGQFSRYSSLWLGLPEEKVLSVDERSLGGRLVHKEGNLESHTLEDILSRISDTDDKRAKEVLAFFFDADKSLEQVARAMIPHASHCCYVLANRTVRRVPIQTDTIFIELGRKYGLEHLVTFHREIPNKYIPLVNAPENVSGKLGATMSKESIVVWKF